MSERLFVDILRRNKEKVAGGVVSRKKKKQFALTGNRTRASRVAGENSTTEPSVRARGLSVINLFL